MQFCIEVTLLNLPEAAANSPERVIRDLENILRLQTSLSGHVANRKANKVNCQYVKRRWNGKNHFPHGQEGHPLVFILTTTNK